MMLFKNVVMVGIAMPGGAVAISVKMDSVTKQNWINAGYSTSCLHNFIRELKDDGYSDQDIQKLIATCHFPSQLVHEANRQKLGVDETYALRRTEYKAAQVLGEALQKDSCHFVFIYNYFHYPIIPPLYCFFCRPVKNKTERTRKRRRKERKKKRRLRGCVLFCFHFTVAIFFTSHH